ncbi:MAG: bifunctional folylpolyglutamate synthase/dihydrofolate synthase [Chloroflexota bacterium]|nr:bifunctional folylpolyglutamate synthase/dihydrofolate synthase [Chloroflexota bacterium]
MRYEDALDYIWGLVNFETKPPETREPYSLERMWALMAQLGDPQERLRVVHVAGTKGKGSTSAMMESVLRAAGHRTALYTSPHLHDPRERLCVGGEPISEEAFIALVERLRPHIESLEEVTTFEALTAMAFLWFAESEVDIAVLEVGLGGRLDATNLVTPLLSVITPLALEHRAVLGDTIEEIAAEKGGIIKPGVPVVTATQSPGALAVLRQIAKERDAPLTVANEVWKGTRTHVSLEGQRFDITEMGQAAGAEIGGGYRYNDLFLPLLGEHQLRNATVAVVALHLLREQGVLWDEAALREGLAGVEWPARVEVLQRGPLVVVDGAHTAESAAALVSTLQEAVVGGWARSTLVLGISGDKNLPVLLDELDPLADRLILTGARHPRAADPTVLAAHPALTDREVRVIPDVAEAMKAAISDAGAKDLIVATGSLFVAAEARASLDSSD